MVLWIKYKLTFLKVGFNKQMVNMELRNLKRHLKIHKIRKKLSNIQSITNLFQNGAYMEQNTTQKLDIPHTNTNYKSNSY